MVGMNEATYKTRGSYEPVYQLCHQAALSWLALGSSYKVFAQASTVTNTGTWTADNTYQAGIGMQSTTNASTLTIPFTAYGFGNYLWYRVIDGHAGTFTWAVDGGSATSVNAFTSPAIATHNGGTQGVGVVRLTGLSVRGASEASITPYG